MLEHGKGEGSRYAVASCERRRDPSPSHAASARRMLLPLPQGDRGRAGGAPRFVACRLSCLLAPTAFAAPTFPPLTGRVVDDAHVLTPDVQADLTNRLAALEAKTGDAAGGGHPVLRSRATTSPITAISWAAPGASGRRARTRAPCSSLRPSEKKTRIEVGYGLEGGADRCGVQRDPEQPGAAAFPPGRRARRSRGGNADAIVQQLGLDPATAQAQAQQAAAAQAQEAAQPQGRPSRTRRLHLLLPSVRLRHLRLLSGRTAEAAAWAGSLPLDVPGRRRLRRRSR